MWNITLDFDGRLFWCTDVDKAHRSS